jgi:hypothetical protein
VKFPSDKFRGLGIEKDFDMIFEIFECFASSSIRRVLEGPE